MKEVIEYDLSAPDRDTLIDVPRFSYCAGIQVTEDLAVIRFVGDKEKGTETRVFRTYKTGETTEEGSTYIGSYWDEIDECSYHVFEL